MTTGRLGHPLRLARRHGHPFDFSYNRWQPFQFSRTAVESTPRFGLEQRRISPRFRLGLRQGANEITPVCLSSRYFSSLPCLRRLGPSFYPTFGTATLLTRRRLVGPVRLPTPEVLPPKRRRSTRPFEKRRSAVEYTVAQPTSLRKQLDVAKRAARNPIK